MQKLIIVSYTMSTENRDFSNLAHGPVRVPLPNENKYSKIMQNSQNFHSYLLILIPNGQFVN